MEVVMVALMVALQQQERQTEAVVVVELLPSVAHIHLAVMAVQAL
jgi:hypothetical protein